MFSWWLIIVGVLGIVVGILLGGRGKLASFSSQDARAFGAKGNQVIAERIVRRKARILARAKKYGRITNDDVEDMFCISDTTARRYLDELEHEGKLLQVGDAGRGVHYIYVEK